MKDAKEVSREELAQLFLDAVKLLARAESAGIRNEDGPIDVPRSVSAFLDQVGRPEFK